MEHDPRLVLALQICEEKIQDFLGLERSDGDFGDVPVLSALSASTLVVGTAELHVCGGILTEHFLVLRVVVLDPH